MINVLKFFILIVIAGLIFVPIVLGEESCSSEPTDSSYGEKYYQRCYCQTLTYPDLDAIASKYGAHLIPDGVVAIDDNWSCGVVIKWNEKPTTDMQECLRLKKEFLLALDSVRLIPRSYPDFICGRDLKEDACAEGEAWACDSLKR